MISLSEPVQIQQYVHEAKLQGKRIGFVPTMGALHEGHASLIRKCLEMTDICIVSIFVNPTQFGQNEDFSKYPRTHDVDVTFLRSLGVDVLFYPTVASMYGDGTPEILFSINTLDKILEGATRPSHFHGVVQILVKLFNVVMPDFAFFGQKDFQQLTIVKRMVKELLFPIEVITCPTMREADGLAMSSRNRYLNADERQQALFLYSSLISTQEYVKAGLSLSLIREKIVKSASAFPSIKLDYFSIRDSDRFDEIETPQNNTNAVALIAAWCGATRLIDNLYLNS